jgi:hypothetical protein
MRHDAGWTVILSAQRGNVGGQHRGLPSQQVDRLASRPRWFEGVIAKRATGAYRSGRSRVRLKIKRGDEQ